MNIRGWTSHNAELVVAIKHMDRMPNPVCINETMLSRAIDDTPLEGYTLIARRDRSDCRTGGGIAAFASEKIAERVMMVMKSEVAERVWLMVHAEQGPPLLGVWYRPPNEGEIQSLSSFKTELQSIADMSVESITVEDLNVHNKRWLHHSSHNSMEGNAMEDVCNDVRLDQKVRQPTREGHLLDLVCQTYPGSSQKQLRQLLITKLSWPT